MKGCGAVIELFRRTVDHTPPVTVVTCTPRRYGKTYLPDGWNNSHVTVRLDDARTPNCR